MTPPRPDRRLLLRRLAILSAGAAGYVVLRRQLAWPTPQVDYARGAASGWLPLATASGLITLPAHVRGAPVLAIVDSGAQYSAVDAGLAERLRLSAASPLPLVAFGVSGGPSVTRAVRVDADLGSFALRGLRAAAFDLNPLSSLTRQPFSLLLGRDFLRAVALEADLPGRRVAIFAAADWMPPAGARPVPTRLHAGGLMVMVGVEGRAPVEVMLDTGATGALALSEATARAAGLLDGRPIHATPSVTLGGVSEDGMVRAGRVEFAGQTFEDVDVQVYRPATHSPAPAGLLGLGILERFHLALDVAAGRVFLLGPTTPPRGRRRAPPARFGGFAHSASPL